MDKIKEAIRRLGYPDGDRYDLPTSAKTFADGAHYRIEISGIERLSNLRAMVDESEKRDVPVHRLIAMVGGPAQIPFEEIRDMAPPPRRGSGPGCRCGAWTALIGCSRTWSVSSRRACVVSCSLTRA
jgi:hypothetical protein